VLLMHTCMYFCYMYDHVSCDRGVVEWYVVYLMNDNMPITTDWKVGGWLSPLKRHQYIIKLYKWHCPPPPLFSCPPLFSFSCPPLLSLSCPPFLSCFCHPLISFSCHPIFCSVGERLVWVVS
jgi:hypothetical protein